MANEGSTKPTYSELTDEQLLGGMVDAHHLTDEDDDKYQRMREEALRRMASLARVRGLLQRTTERLNNEYRASIGEVWHWQGDEYDNLESLTCPILISANDLRKLLFKGAESADIGKLDAADKSGKVNRVDENAKLKELLRRGYHLFNVEGTDFAEPEEVGEKWMEEVEAELKAGSAETGGEKAAPYGELVLGISDDGYRLAEKFHEVYERLAPTFGYETRAESAKPWDEVPLRNQQLMAATCTEILKGGVERAHEGTTADKSVALADSSLSQKCEHRRLNAGVKGTFCADCGQEVKTDKCFRPETILASESSLSSPPPETDSSAHTSPVIQSTQHDTTKEKQ